MGLCNIIAQNRGKEKLPIHKQKGLNVSPDKFVFGHGSPEDVV